MKKRLFLLFLCLLTVSSLFVIPVSADEYDQGYNAGLGQGYEEGHEKGYSEGYVAAFEEAKALYGLVSGLTGSIFDYCTFSAVLYTSKDGPSIATDLGTFSPNSMVGGVFFSSLWDKVNVHMLNLGDPDWAFVDRVEIVLRWSGSGVFDFASMPIKISGSSEIQYASLTTTEGKVYSLDASDSGLRNFVISDPHVLYPVIVEEIVLRVGRPQDLLLEFSLYASAELYQQGYAAGVADYLNMNQTEITDHWFNEGYGKGFDDGRVEGMFIAEKGDFSSLFTALLEAPVNAFQSLFHFEILGMDMRVFVGSLLSICLILILVHKWVI